MPASSVAVAVAGAGREHLAHDAALRVGGQPEVEEAGPGDVGRGDAVVPARASASQPAKSRGGTPSFLATCRARLVA